MKSVVAIDSFKESVSSQQAAEAAKEGILSVFPQMTIKTFLLADGGEGTVNAIISGCGGETVPCEVTSGTGEKISSYYGIINESKIAVIEIANIAGLSMIPVEKRNPLYATSFGLGEIIVDALNREYRKFIICLGGSSTNDCGIGMLEALGYKFLNSEGKPVGKFGKDVSLIKSVDDEDADPRLKDCSFIIASDVNNPLCGKNGASAVFGPQKGANTEMVESLDNALESFSKVTAKHINNDYSKTPGAGAAGGLGFALISYLNATIKPGVETVINLTGIEQEIVDADYVITGEGRLDQQTTMGKAPMGIAKIAKKYSKPVLAISGCVSEGASKCNDIGIDAFFPIVQKPVTLQEALDIESTKENIKKTIQQIFKLIAITIESQK